MCKTALDVSDDIQKREGTIRMPHILVDSQKYFEGNFPLYCTIVASYCFSIRSFIHLSPHKYVSI